MKSVKIKGCEIPNEVLERYPNIKATRGRLMVQSNDEKFSFMIREHHGPFEIKEDQWSIDLKCDLYILAFYKKEDHIQVIVF